MKDKSYSITALLIIVLCIFVMTFSSCNSVATSSVETSDRITYFKDYRTNLCFGQIVSRTRSGYNVVSITFVPCDSLNNLILP